ncbi:hypothetical protein HPB48_019787 [Haemaphysalis longicornis]|uniref:Uncharacterized protein n=1 Tax=Haemaphysalis longicornis TaxID=44386 RepID=A0A9J6GZ93_HAELO|nr:hypothetical protein HPB48_019787 [Haemaphysalis longicornis]
MPKWILIIADFLDVETSGDLLRADRAMLEKACELSSFKKTKTTISEDKLVTNYSDAATGVIKISKSLPK